MSAVALVGTALGASPAFAGTFGQQASIHVNNPQWNKIQVCGEDQRGLMNPNQPPPKPPVTFRGTGNPGARYVCNEFPVGPNRTVVTTNWWWQGPITYSGYSNNPYPGVAPPYAMGNCNVPLSQGNNTFTCPAFG